MAYFLIAVAGFSVLSLFHVTVFSLPIFKIAAFLSMALAVFSVSSKTDCRPSKREIWAATLMALTIIFAGTYYHWDAFLSAEMWLIKPTIFISICLLFMPFLTKIRYETLDKKILCIIVSLLMLSVYAQALYLLISNQFFDFQQFFGFPPSRSFYSSPEVEFIRLTGFADEPASYCTMMFCLLLITDPRKFPWYIRILAEASIVLTLSSLGWIMVAILYYRTLLLEKRKLAILTIVASLLVSILLVFAIHPPAATEKTAMRILSARSDPSATVRLFAFLPGNIDKFLKKYSACSDQNCIVPDRQDILNSNVTGIIRSSNYNFVKTAFSTAGLIAFTLIGTYLAFFSKTILSVPVIFLGLTLLTSITEPIFWIGIVAFASQLRYTRKPITS
ncbi:MAG: hypothetical protein ACK6BL_02595 [Holosporaceae bacterium]